MASSTSADSSWERVLREVFAGDAARMLSWGRRYLAAYPDVNGPAFHLGAAFRRIVGPRNREQWWRKAVALLDARVPEGVSDLPPPVYEARAPHVHHPTTSVEERLRSFDETVARQRRREKGLPATATRRPPRERGWTREELHDRERGG